VTPLRSTALKPVKPSPSSSLFIAPPNPANPSACNFSFYVNDPN
jgi:hypothetical protein